ncbi:hypothetical protein LCGC14_0392010 [marine sediment metagenome]|uniref:Uncharacterized protein n=1 Tax=marine sediment metagenome TaxID=412755 RepID=A0A0F9TH99_9ZZZZ
MYIDPMTGQNEFECVADLVVGRAVFDYMVDGIKWGTRIDGLTLLTRSGWLVMCDDSFPETALMANSEVGRCIISNIIRSS